MLKGILTGMLSKETRDKGYELSEDEDFVYLYQHGKLNKTWDRRQWGRKQVFIGNCEYCTNKKDCGDCAYFKSGVGISDIEKAIKEGV